jgi:hypothetical protein
VHADKRVLGDLGRQSPVTRQSPGYRLDPRAVQVDQCREGALVAGARKPDQLRLARCASGGQR